MCDLFRAEDSVKETAIEPAQPIKQATVSVSNLATSHAEVRVKSNLAVPKSLASGGVGGKFYPTAKKKLYNVCVTDDKIYWPK